MKKINFPVVSQENNAFPDKALCPWCKNNKVLEPHSFASINGGVLIEENSKYNKHEVCKVLEAYLDLSWHGAHPEDGGHGKNSNIYVRLPLAEDVKEGQFNIYFCSTQCLREFLNSYVDELESRIRKEKKAI